MGVRGPVGKRSDQRHGHRSQEENSVTKVAVGEGFVAPLPADPTWHPIARDWFEALANSGQSHFYEPSDWATARFVAHLMDEVLSSPRTNGMLVSSIKSYMESLLTTEGDRRRVHVELERNLDIDPDLEAARAYVAENQAILAEELTSG